MEVFTQLTQLHAEHGTAWAAFQKSICACRDADAAITARIDRDRDARADLVAELQTIIDDTDRSEGSRRLAALELERVRSEAVKPTADELEMYHSELECAEEALRAVRSLGEQYRAAHDAALVQLMSMRKSVLGNSGLVGADNRLESARQTYEKLCKEVNGNG